MAMFGRKTDLSAMGITPLSLPQSIMPGDQPIPTQRNPFEAAAVKKSGPDWFKILTTAAGVTGDALQQASGGQATFTPMFLEQMMQKQKLEAAAKQEQAQREWEMQKWQAQQDYERQNPDGEFADMLRMGGIDPNSEEAQVLAAQRARNMADPVVNVQLPGGEMWAGPRSQMGQHAPLQAPTGPTPQAVDHLRANPNLAAAFDEKYGQGASTQYLGGQTQPASGGFLR